MSPKDRAKRELPLCDQIIQITLSNKGVKMGKFIMISKPWIDNLVNICEEILGRSEHLDISEIPSERTRDIVKGTLGVVWQVMGILKYLIVQDDELNLPVEREFDIEEGFDSIYNLMNKDE